MSIPISGPNGLPQLSTGTIDPFGNPPVIPVDYGTPADTLNVPYDNYLRPPEYDIQNFSGHGFIVGDAVRATTATERSGGAAKYKKAIASDTVTGDGSGTLNAQQIGIVTAVGSGSEAAYYMVQFGGIVAIGGVSSGRYTSNFSSGTLYYLSNTTAGAGNSSAPVAGTPGAYVKPIFITLDNVNVILINDRPAQSTLGNQIFQFSQSSPSFIIGNAVYYNGTTWQLASASAFSTAKSIGVITSVNGTTYQVTMFGIATIGNVIGGLYPSNFTANQLYYLSAITPGLGVTSENEMLIKRPLFLTLSATQVLVFSQIPEKEYLAVIGSGPPNLTVGTPLTPLGFSGGVDNYAISTVNSLASANSTGIISRVINSSGAYEIANAGVISVFSSLNPGSTYFLAGSGGTYTTTQPTITGTITKPCFIAINTTTAMLTPIPAYYYSSGKINFITPVNIIVEQTPGGVDIDGNVINAGVWNTISNLQSYGIPPSASAILISNVLFTSQGGTEYSISIRPTGSGLTPVILNSPVSVGTAYLLSSQQTGSTNLSASTKGMFPISTSNGGSFDYYISNTFTEYLLMRIEGYV